MSTLHAIFDSLAAMGSIYGWRIDAMLLGGLLWALAAGYTQLRATTA